MAGGPRVLAPSESELRRRIHNYLNRALIQNAVTDARKFNTSQGPRFGVYPDGWPDITASIPLTGRAWGIEIKTEDGKLRPSQEAMLPRLQASGWLISIVRSVEEVSHELKIQLSLLDQKELNAYFCTIRQLDSIAEAKKQELLEKKRLARARQA